ncbi:MAG: tRNA 2-thiouridine synthesizing protein C [Patiriisocius sp.]|jgi:tRNA 2-thiouridine synthesizing protein C
MNETPIINTPYIVIQTTQPPYSSSTAIDSIEAALAATNIGIKIIYMFVGDGVYQLLNEQRSRLISHKSVYKKLNALPLFDVDLLFAQASAIRDNKISLNEVSLTINVIEDAKLVEICAKAQQVLVF